MREEGRRMREEAGRIGEIEKGNMIGRSLEAESRR